MVLAWRFGHYSAVNIVDKPPASGRTLPVVIALVNTAHPLDPDPALTGLDVLAWRAGEALRTPVNADPEYLRALFNTESTWAAAQTSEAAR